MKKRISVLGRGTAGALSIVNFLKFKKAVNKNIEIEWLYDENIKPQAVGEGSTLSLPNTLFNGLGFVHGDLSKIDGTFKHGIRKINWGNNPDYIHEFSPPHVAYHFNAVKLQRYILDTVDSSILVKTGNFSYEDIDSDFILDCSGVNNKKDLFYQSEAIPVNSAYVTQCYWNLPEFFHTLTIARPYGWVFGIPLQNRCSIGYLFNSEINTLEEVKEDAKEIFATYNLIPSNDTNHIKFGNYYRKENFNGRIGFNGNASFFLEPLEATSLSVMDSVCSLFLDTSFNGMPDEVANKFYIDRLTDVERIIALHYFAGSKFKTDFWRLAEEKGTKCIEKACKDANWVSKIQASKYAIRGNFFDPLTLYNRHKFKINGVEEWSLISYNNNLSSLGLNIYSKLDKLIGNVAEPGLLHRS